MKCEKCGKNMASYHYKSNVNGKVTEMHLCPECAGESKEAMSVFGSAESMFEDMMDSFFPRNRRSFLSPFGSFGGFGGFGSLGLMAPSLFMPRIELVIEEPKKAEEKNEGKAEIKTEENPQVDPEMAKRREINALREEMKAAVEAENFEKAAELRDKIRILEK